MSGSSSPDYKVLVLDLDGTTLMWGDRIHEADVAAARRLHDAGVHVTIATGRLYAGTLGAVEALRVRGHVAVMNGSEHVHGTEGTVRHRWAVDRADRVVVREVFGRIGLESFLFSHRVIHHGRRSARHAPYLRIWTDELREHHDVLEADAWHEGDDVLGVCAAGSEEEIRAAEVALDGRLSEELEVVTFGTFTGERFLQVRHRHEDKGTALRRLAEERGATAAQTVAVGDWMNDVPLLRAAGRGFVMNGAKGEVLDVADEVLDARRGEGGGIAEVARKVWGL